MDNIVTGSGELHSGVSARVRRGGHAAKSKGLGFLAVELEASRRKAKSEMPRFTARKAAYRKSLSEDTGYGGVTSGGLAGTTLGAISRGRGKK